MFPLLLSDLKPSFSLCIRLTALLKLAPPQEFSFLPDILDISTRLSSARNLLTELEVLQLLLQFLSCSSFRMFSLLFASHCLALSVSLRISSSIRPLPLPLPLPVPGLSFTTPDTCFFITTISLYLLAFLRSSSISCCLFISSSFFFLIILILASTSSSLLAFSSALSIA